MKRLCFLGLVAMLLPSCFDEGCDDSAMSVCLDRDSGIGHDDAATIDGTTGTFDQDVTSPDEGMGRDHGLPDTMASDGPIPPDGGMTVDGEVPDGGTPDEGIEEDAAMDGTTTDAETADATDPDMGGCVPAQEICDGEDNDCDGEVDEHVLNACGSCGELGDEVCDGEDNDCDGETDEGFPSLGEPCSMGIGVCNRDGEIVCSEDGSRTVCSAVPGNPEDDDPCDGEDNDCDGSVDEDAQGEEIVCGVGACRHTIVACNGGNVPECNAMRGASPEVCDDIDNDCDGEVDEGTLNACGACGPAPRERCNGIDDNCNDQVDELFPELGEECEVNLLACDFPGVFVCSEDGQNTVCMAEFEDPTPEVCDGEDNDCDGSVDNNVPGVGQACVVGVGVCRREGERVCAPPNVVCNVQPGQPNGREICNGLDDDCNGVTDDSIDGVGDPCTEGEGACERDGTIICNPQEGLVCNAQPGNPAEEACNQIDDDCDGETDEGIPGVGDACVVGIGACERDGEFICSAQGIDCVGQPGVPGEETCNGIDDDCDGETDENLPLGDGNRFEFQCPNHVLDTESGLVWERVSTGGLNHQQAFQHCQDAGMRLPTIDELRTIIDGCAPTESGGNCQAHDQCAGDVQACTGSCAGCGVRQGPGPAGNFVAQDIWDDNIPDGNWSSTCDAERCLYFIPVSGGIAAELKRETGVGVRCVRNN